MKNWTKRILNVAKGKKGESMSDPDEGSYDEVTKLIEKLNQPDPEATIKKGSKVKFFDVSSEIPGGCWMEGYVGQRITKLSHSKASNYKQNYYNITQIKLILNFGNTSGNYPEERCVNLSPGSCWTLVRIQGISSLRVIQKK